MNLAIILAHPDDEFFAAASVCELKQICNNVYLVYTTSGEGARYTDRFRQDGEDRIAVRKREARRSAFALGITNTVFLGFPDPEPQNGKMACGFTVTKLTDRLENYFHEHDINICITHGADGEYGHPAHISVYKSVLKAANSCQSVNFVFTFNAYDIMIRSLFQTNLSEPANYSFTTQPHNQTRKSILEAHSSQLLCFAPYRLINSEEKKNNISALITNILNLRKYETMHLSYSSSDTACFKPWQLGLLHQTANKLLTTLSSLTPLPQKILAKILSHI